MRSPRRIASLLAVAALAATAVVAVSVPAQARAPRKASVTIKGLAFHPRTRRIRRGGTVTWRFRDGSIRHNVRGRGFHSHTMRHGVFRHRFRHKGTFRYHCTIHPGMTGKVVVR